jgi:predicted transcriptional regulator
MDANMATNVRVDEQLHAVLRELSEAEQRPIGVLIADAIDAYRTAKFWEQARRDYERLRADPAEWAEYQAEVALWDSVAGDGLEREEPYYSPDEEADLNAQPA